MGILMENTAEELTDSIGLHFFAIG